MQNGTIKKCKKVDDGQSVRRSPCKRNQTPETESAGVSNRNFTSNIPRYVYLNAKIAVYVLHVNKNKKSFCIIQYYYYYIYNYYIVRITVLF